MTGFTLLKGILGLCMVGSLLCSYAAPSATASPQRPFPQHTTYAPNTIRPNHRTQIQMDDDVRAFYGHWKAQYLATVAGTPTRYRVTVGYKNPGRTVSEGQGYGMVIVALMAGYDPDAQTIFDGLWYFVHDHPSNIDARLMAWEIPEDVGGEDSAFDGDADIAYALLLAHAQWGSQGAINYQAEAQQLITAIKESTIGPDSHLPTLGDWVEFDGDERNQYTPRSSDFMPAHFRAYGRATGDAAWTAVLNTTQATISSLQDNYSPQAGLLPDFIEPVSEADHTPRPADADFLEGPEDGHYYYNAGRDPWRIGTDALINNDATSMQQTRRMADWVAGVIGDDPDNIMAGYYLDGTPLPDSDYFTTFFVAPFGVALMTRPGQQQRLNAVYNAVYNTYDNYYEDSITLLSLLVMTGNYWDPTIVINRPVRTYLSVIFQ